MFGEHVASFHVTVFRSSSKLLSLSALTRLKETPLSIRHQQTLEILVVAAMEEEATGCSTP